MQEEWLQESGEQMLARVEYALRQEQAVISWGLPSPRWSLQQDQRNRRWVGWHLCFSIVVGLLCQQLAPENWEGVWWLYWWYVIPTLLCSIWFFAGPYLHSSHFLKTDKTYPRTVDGSAYTTPEAYAYWNYAPPQGCCHLYLHRAKLIIECGAKQHIIDLQEHPYQLEINSGYVLILKPIGAVEGWIIMEVWSRKLDVVAQLLAHRFDWRVIRY